jgi:DNA-binding NtrC family response regulator
MPLAVILDKLLPGGSGMTLLQIAREIHPFVAALIVTGDFDGDVACAAATLGAACLPKPFALEDLDGWLLHALGSPVQPADTDPAAPDEERLLARLTETMLDQLDARYELGQCVHRLRYASAAGDADPASPTVA